MCRQRGLHAETAVTSDSHLLIGPAMVCHLGHIRYCSSSFPGLVCSLFLEASSWELWQLLSRLQTGHHLVNFSTS